MTAVRTVLGDVPAAELGQVDAHDHLFFRSAQFPPGQELDDPGAAADELRAFAALGGGTVVQWTPYGLGRGSALLPEVSRAAGVHVVAATGLHQAAHYPPGTVERVLAGGLAELFIGELTEGLLAGETDEAGEAGQAGAGGDGRLPHRAGMVKVAGSFHSLDRHARTVMAAAAEAHHATGAPIGIHLEHGSAALDVLDLLCGQLAVPAARRPNAAPTSASTDRHAPTRPRTGGCWTC